MNAIGCKDARSLTRALPSALPRVIADRHLSKRVEDSGIYYAVKLRTKKNLLACPVEGYSKFKFLRVRQCLGGQAAFCVLYELPESVSQHKSVRARESVEL